jgi:hypothetical protein
MSVIGQPPEGENWLTFCRAKVVAFYGRKLAKPLDKLVDIVVSALFTYAIHLIIHALLLALGIGEKDTLDKSVHRWVGYLTIGSYFVYVLHLLASDASEQASKAFTEIRGHWTRRDDDAGAKGKDAEN